MNEPIATLGASDRMMVCGVTGSGKSYFTRHEFWMPAEKVYARVLVWDWHGEYQGTSYTLAELTQLLATRRLVPEKLKAFRIAIRPQPAMDDPYDSAGIQSFVRVVQSSFRNTVVIVEESGVYAEQGHARMALVYLATQSRHWGCPLVFVTQYANLIHKGIRRQCSMIVSFLQYDSDDLEALRPKFGRDADETIPQLRVGEYLYWRGADVLSGKPRQDRLF